MFGLSASHLIILGIIALLFGAKRLPELGSGLGKGMRAFKDAMDGKNLLTRDDSTDVEKRERALKRPHDHST